VAPLWAALLARINASTGKTAGFVNPLLYPDAQACRDVTQGNNGDYAAKPGWDACTGLAVRTAASSPVCCDGGSIRASCRANADEGTAPIGR